MLIVIKKNTDDHGDKTHRLHRAKRNAARWLLTAVIEFTVSFHVIFCPQSTVAPTGTEPAIVIEICCDRGMW